jgi:hypothetical protein
MVLQMGTPTDKIDTLFKFMKYYDKVESNLSVLVPRKSSKKWILFVYLHIHIIFFPAMKPENHFHLRVLPANMVWAMFDSFNFFQTIIINIHQYSMW